MNESRVVRRCPTCGSKFDEWADLCVWCYYLSGVDHLGVQRIDAMRVVSDMRCYMEQLIEGSGDWSEANRLYVNFNLLSDILLVTEDCGDDNILLAVRLMCELMDGEMCRRRRVIRLGKIVRVVLIVTLITISLCIGVYSLYFLRS